MYSRSVKCNGITSPSRQPTLRNKYHVICDVIERRAVVFKCLTCSTFDDVTNDVILPLGWVGQFVVGESQSRIYPNMCAKCGCGPTVVSKRGVQADRQRGTAALYSR